MVYKPIVFCTKLYGPLTEIPSLPQACQDHPDSEDQGWVGPERSGTRPFPDTFTEMPLCLLESVWCSLPSGAERSVQLHEQRVDAGKTGEFVPAAH